MLAAGRRLCDQVDELRFAPPVTHTYNPLRYAWEAHELYLRRYAATPKRVLFLGMNPGPFGMAQTGVPFGDVAAVRDWLGIQTKIGAPENQHPKRLVTGFACKRREISGERLWNLFAKRFGSARLFFHEHFVANYCPLAFLEASGRNRTPDKLARDERAALFPRCDQHLREIVGILQPEWIIGVGEFAARRAGLLFSDRPRVAQILHPSPACPASNSRWLEKVTARLEAIQAWTKETTIQR